RSIYRQTARWGAYAVGRSPRRPRTEGSHRMLAATRRFAKSWAAALIIGLLIISFAVFGINDVFNFSFSNAVIKAGDREVSQAQFSRRFDNVKSNIEAQQGRPVTVQELDERGLVSAILDSIAGEEGFFAWAWRAGLRPAQS